MGRQVAKGRHERADLVNSRKTKQAKVRRNDAKLALAEVKLGDDRSARLAPRQLQA